MKLNSPAKVVLVGLALSLFGPLASYARAVAPFTGFRLLLLGGFLALIGAVGEGVRLLKKRPVNSSAFMGFIPLLLALIFFTRASAFPRLNDVSTDLQDVPQFIEAGNLEENAGRDMTFPEPFKPLVRTHYPNLEGTLVAGTPEAVINRTVALLKQQPYFVITRDDRPAMELEGIAESALFKFKDDFILRFRTRGASTQVDMRSKSRHGQGDVGANAIRIRAVMTAIQKGEW